MDFKFAVEPKKEEEESGSYERARKPAKKASDEEKNKLSEKKMREYASEIKKIKESLDEDNEDLILKEYAQKILKNQEPVGHVEKKRMKNTQKLRVPARATPSTLIPREF